MIKVVTVIGARPQIIKAAAISRAIKNNFQNAIKEVIIHTGQHYDENMSQVFFDELQIPKPDYNLNVGSTSHGKQTAAMITGIEEIILKEAPACCIVYGDTNSTLAAAVAASKINVPVVHIEAGLRSFNKTMPEEINRITCDHCSTLLFSPTKSGIENLKREGFNEHAMKPYSINNPKVFHCGDVMYDNSLHFAAVAEKQSSVLKDLDLNESDFILATIHRNSNTDDAKRLTSIFKALNAIVIQHKLKLVLPLHPRTKKMLSQNLSPEIFKTIDKNPLIKITAPVSFLEMIALEKNARIIITDSGGVQKESFFFKKPCIVLRPETEWIELVENGNNILADADENRITEAFEKLFQKNDFTYPQFYGDAHAAEFICNEILKCFAIN